MKPMVLDCGVWATKLCLSVYLRFGFCNIMSGVCRRYHTEWRKHCNGCSTVDCIIMILIAVTVITVSVRGKGKLMENYVLILQIILQFPERL